MNENTITKNEIKAPRSYDAIVADIVEYFNENTDVLNNCLEELDAYNGYLGDDRYCPMYELDEIYNGSEPSEILARAFFGYDEDTYTTDSSGNREYGAFNPTRDYFRFNGYGNLVSTNYRDYSERNDGNAVTAMFENRAYIDTIDENDDLRELFDELEALNADDE